MDSDAPRPTVGRLRRPIIDGSGQFHASVMAAAVAHDMTPGNAWIKAKLQRAGWRFADEPPRAPAAPPPAPKR